MHFMPHIVSIQFQRNCEMKQVVKTTFAFTSVKWTYVGAGGALHSMIYRS